MFRPSFPQQRQRLALRHGLRHHRRLGTETRPAQGPPACVVVPRLRRTGLPCPPPPSLLPPLRRRCCCRRRRHAEAQQRGETAATAPLQRGPVRYPLGLHPCRALSRF